MPASKLARHVALGLLALYLVQPVAGAPKVFQMVENDPPVTDNGFQYLTGDRKDLGVRVNDICFGTLIHPLWVITAKHCTLNGKKKDRNPRDYVKINGARTGVQRIYRAPNRKDVVLFKLKIKVGESRRMPVLLMKNIIQANDGVVKLKQDSGYVGQWSNIPARARKHNNLYVGKDNRKGGAGVSGSGMFIHVNGIGDVLVAVLHGTGRNVQLGSVSTWIKGLTNGETWWASRETVLD